MLVVVETNPLLEKLKSEVKDSRLILIPIWKDPNQHPRNTKLSCLYFYLIDHNKSYILPIDHPEAIDFEVKSFKFLNNGKEKFVLDKKSFLFFKRIPGLIDIDLVSYFNTNKPYDLENCFTSCHRYYYNRLYDFKDVNLIIPILKHFEYCENVRWIVLNDIVDWEPSETFNGYNNDIIESLSWVESNGLRVNTPQFVNRFGKDQNKHISRSTVYTRYNIYTTTGRPSNSFGGVNYAGLNKEDGSRIPFVSRFSNGLLVQYDYDAYHLQLIANMVGYDFRGENIHNHLAKLYFDTDNVTPEQYKESKQVSFKLLYGGISRMYRTVPFFNKVNEYIDDLWDIYNKYGYVETPVYKKKLKREFFTDMNKNKLFNYVLQALETETNFNILSKVLKFLQDSKSKLVLYTYDSYLIDFCLDDGRELLDTFKGLIENDSKLPTTISYGANYSELREL